MTLLARTVVGDGNSERVELYSTVHGYSVDVASKGFITGRGFTDYIKALDVYLDAVKSMIHAETARQ